MAPLLALAAAVLAVIAALAAAPPGLFGRLRALVVARAAPAPADPTDDPTRVSPLERTVARLVPLAVMDGDGADERAPSTAPRSAVRRILPPT